MNVLIRPLLKFDRDSFLQIADGYTSNQFYSVSVTNTLETPGITLRLEALDTPFRKRWSWEGDELARYTKMVGEEGLSLEACAGDLTVGIAIVERHAWNRSVQVCELHVRNVWRGCGVGRLLMNSLIQSARNEGLATVMCETQNTNVPAVLFYRSMGLELTGIDVAYYPPELNEVAMFMKLRL